MRKDAKILIVEDDETLHKMYLRLFSNKGYTILDAFNGKAAVEITEKEQPDYVIMDLRMPVMMGDEAIKRIRALPIKQPYILVLTNSYKEMVEATALAKGADEVVQKDLMLPKELRKKIEDKLKER